MSINSTSVMRETPRIEAWGQFPILLVPLLPLPKNQLLQTKAKQL